MQFAMHARIGFAIGISCLTFSAAAEAVAPCCASGDNGRPNAVTSSSLTDLGKTAPQAQNMSRVPDWQAFVFVRGSVQYVELADAAGVPRAAFGISGDNVLALPIGSDVVQQVAVAPALATTVFQDNVVVVGVMATADGSTTWQVYVK